MDSISIEELKEKLGEVPLVDVRESHEYLEGHVPTAVNIPLSQLDEKYKEVESGSYIICQSGMRSMRACQALETQGIATINVAGGTSAWDDKLEK